MRGGVVVSSAATRVPQWVMVRGVVSAAATPVPQWVVVCGVVCSAAAPAPQWNVVRVKVGSAATSVPQWMMKPVSDELPHRPLAMLLGWALLRRWRNSERQVLSVGPRRRAP